MAGGSAVGLDTAAGGTAAGVGTAAGMWVAAPGRRRRAAARLGLANVARGSVARCDVTTGRAAASVTQVS